MADPQKRCLSTSHIAFALLVIFFVLYPSATKAASTSTDRPTFMGKVKSIFASSNNDTPGQNDIAATSQTIPLFKAVIVDDEATSENSTVNEEAESLSAVSGPMRVSTEDIDFPMSDAISVYEVKKGDTLATVAKLFGVSKNTIIWANDLKSEAISPGDTLVILPMTGIKHVVKKGDTLATIAKKYKADIGDIAKFNGLAADSDLAVGDTVLVPDGEIQVAVPKSTKSSSKGKLVIGKEKLLNTYSYTAPSGFLIRPVVNARKTQGLHGHNGIDLGAPIGTPVIASANGRVILAKMGGYNGGYGNMIIISHDNNIQTVYAHLSAINVSAGDTLTQGQLIGAVGNTGRSTGPHLHFEVRGAKNPF